MTERDEMRPIKLQPWQVDFLAARKLRKDQICKMFRVPVWMVDPQAWRERMQRRARWLMAAEAGCVAMAVASAFLGVWGVTRTEWSGCALLLGGATLAVGFMALAGDYSQLATRCLRAARKP